ncbi:hypothetical protein P8X24_07495 [Pyrococcus kukulkanii]|uniref:hypothetical protein n=1 Tax=Pyrococcus kukulkanii TaxID=1609559 RepID=UPI00356A30E3
MSGKIKFRKEDGRGEIENTLGRGYYHTRTIFMERNPFLGTYKVNKYPLLLISLVPLIFDHPFIPMLLVGLVLATINAYGHYHKSKATL